VSESVLFALRREFLAAVPVLAACGKSAEVASPTQDEPAPAEILSAPESFLDEILYDFVIRPVIGRPFNVRFAPGMNTDFGRAQLSKVEDMTRGDVRFTYGSGPVTLDIGVSDTDPAILNPAGGTWGAVASLNLNGHVIESARIIFAFDWITEYEAIWLHEIAHVLGYGHVQGGQFIMGSADPHQPYYHQWECDAWRRLRSLPVSASSSLRQTAHVCSLEKP
jgi:hypothetical protein